MLQILSTSNETSTGPELVQNGDFSELGSDLVTNGDFSAVPLGSELITNGDFAVSGTLTSASWTLGWNTPDSGLSISDGVLNLVNDGSGFVGRAYVNNGVNSDRGIIQVGKKYLLTYEVKENTDAATLKYYAGSYVSISKDVGIHTFEFTATNDLFIFRNGSSNTTIKIDNVSLKEQINLITNPNFTDTGSELVLNNDFSSSSSHWSHQNNSTISVGTHEGRSDVANINITGTSTADRIEQSFTYVDGKSYKVTIEVYVVSGSFRIDSRDTFVTTDFLSTTTTGEWQTLTAYITAIQSGTDVIWLRSKVPGEVSQFYVDSVSIKELGEDWTVIDGGGSVTFGDSFAEIIKTSSTPTLLQQDYAVTLGASHKLTYTVTENTLPSSSDELALSSGSAYGYSELDASASATPKTVYLSVTDDTPIAALRLFSRGASGSIKITDISVQELGEGWTIGDKWSLSDEGARLVSSTSDASGLSQSDVFEIGKSYKVTLDAVVNSGIAKLEKEAGAVQFLIDTTKTYVEYFTATQTSFYLNRYTSVSDIYINNISVQQLDPNGHWNTNPNWLIEQGQAVSDGTNVGSLNQSGVTTLGKTYVAKYDILTYTSGTGFQQRVGSGSAYSNAETSIATHSTTQIATGNNYIYINPNNTIGSITNVSVKLLGTYEDQSIYVTAADVQTIPQASVYYLVELTSMASKNSIYFLPSSVVPNNGRYTKLNFTVVSKDALPTPASGIISFYDSVGGFDTYPMGFYEFRIYEQTSSTNLDPLLATGLLEKGFAFVRDFSGNMQELTDGFKEYNPTLTQYVYSK